jgi:hypothetical protein
LVLCEGSLVYTYNVTTMAIFKHPQKNATGNNKTSIRSLQDAMHQYHHKHNTVADYTEAVNLAQR